MNTAEIIQTILNNLLLTIYIVSTLVVIGIVILENRSPVKTISWIMVLLLFPILGILFYIFFGQNLRKQKVIAKKGLKNDVLITQSATAQIHRLSESILAKHPKINKKRHIIRLLHNNSASVVTIGNKVSVLRNGTEKFPALLDAIESAKHFIHLQYYIFSNDRTSTQVWDLLIQKAKEGVEVRVIVDDVGSWELKDSFFDQLKKKGVDVFSFLKVRFPHLTSRVNYRNHRKIAVIDGTIGFLGGINIADRYWNIDPDKVYWRDTHLKIEGDAVNSLNKIFLTDWYFVSQIELSDSKYFPPKIPIGDTLVQIVASGPDTEWPAIMMAFFSIIATAKKYVYLSTPYFMPNESVILALKAAALGGVDVKLIIPEKSDTHIAHLCTKSYIHEMLEAGVEIYMYKKGFLHCKTIVVDDVVSTVGSTNMDFRSFEQNFEVNAFIYDIETAEILKQQFFHDIVDSELIDPDEWDERSLTEKTKESFARLLSPLL